MAIPARYKLLSNWTRTGIETYYAFSYLILLSFHDTGRKQKRIALQLTSEVSLTGGKYHVFSGNIIRTVDEEMKLGEIVKFLSLLALSKLNKIDGSLTFAAWSKWN